MNRNTCLFRSLPVIALLGASLLAAGCNREDAPPAGPADANAITDAQVEAALAEDAQTDAIAVVENSAADSITADSKGFDSKSFAGSFLGTLPCASCPGIETTIQFNADGTYALTETHMGEKDGPQVVDGTWTVEDDGKQVRLDPSSKTEPDRLYAIASNDAIVMLDEAGKSAQSTLDYTLKRAASTQ